jgi:hypothetical protein
MNRGQIMSEDERKEILDWIYKNKSSFESIYSNRICRVIVETKEEKNTTEMNPDVVYPYDPTMPTSIWDIKRRIIEKEGLSEYAKEPLLGDFILIIFAAGSLPRHIDENVENNIHCRFNVILETPIKGGETFYNDKNIGELTSGSYILCKSGLENHFTNFIEEGNRITISFGFLIPKERVDTMIF